MGRTSAPFWLSPQANHAGERDVVMEAPNGTGAVVCQPTQVSWMHAMKYAGNGAGRASNLVQQCEYPKNSYSILNTMQTLF
jgi:hypothetical protein